MKQIITIALYLLLPISIYSQTLQKEYKDGIEGHLEKGNCEDAERVYRAGTKNNVIEVDKDIESRIAECKGSTISIQNKGETKSTTKTIIFYQSLNGHEYVDLGLPSGIKWATCNVGANSPEEYGDYFAWGETSTKENYTSSNSKTKEKDMGDISGKSSYDVARATWRGAWRLPTKEEWKELRDKNNCIWEWTTLNGVNGYKVTSRYNKKSIFLPAAGNRGGSSFYDAVSYGNYWSSSPCLGTLAYSISFSSSVFCVGWDDCYIGYSIRPVCE